MPNPKYKGPKSGKLASALPTALWVGYDSNKDFALVNTVEPAWITEDPEGEDPGEWRQITRDEIARMLVEDT